MEEKKIKICPFCLKKFRESANTKITNRKYCCRRCSEQNHKKTSKIKKFYVDDNTKKELELEKFAKSGKNYKNLEMETLEKCNCLWCRVKFTKISRFHKYCCQECRDSFNSTQDAIHNTYFFNGEECAFQLDLLNKNGKNYKLPERQL